MHGLRIGDEIGDGIEDRMTQLTTPGALPDALVTYLAARDADRAERLDVMWGELTERERGLVKDAAVMGYVQGSMSERGAKIPRDSDVVRIVLGACDAFDDLYPTISALGSDS